MLSYLHTQTKIAQITNHCAYILFLNIYFQNKPKSHFTAYILLVVLHLPHIRTRYCQICLLCNWLFCLFSQLTGGSARNILHLWNRVTIISKVYPLSFVKLQLKKQITEIDKYKNITILLSTDSV